MDPLTIFLMITSMQERLAEERIKQAQYCEAVERRAQHREVERVQPEFHLTPAEEAANHKAAADRLILPQPNPRR